MHPKVTVLGSSNVDLTAQVAALPAPGETVLAADFTVSAGGKGANQALACALCGVDTEFIGAVGRDEAAQTALSQLSEASVRLARVQRTAQRTGMALIQVDEAGENCITVVPGANAAMDAAAVRSVGALHGLLVLQGEIPASGILEAIDRAEGRVVLNLAPVIALPVQALLAADPLVVNEVEARAALQLLGVDPPAEASGEDLVRGFRQAGVASVVVTLGARGCVAGQGQQLHRLPAVEVESVIDSTGAGDAFTGALAAGLAQGLALADAARQAMRFAAICVQRRGAQDSYPRDFHLR